MELAALRKVNRELVRFLVKDANAAGCRAQLIKRPVDYRVWYKFSTTNWNELRTEEVIKREWGKKIVFARLFCKEIPRYVDITILDGIFVCDEHVIENVAHPRVNEVIIAWFYSHIEKVFGKV